MVITKNQFKKNVFTIILVQLVTLYPLSNMPDKSNYESKMAISSALLTPTNTKSYAKLRQEFKALADRNSSNKVCISQAENRELAPKLYDLLQSLTKELIEQTTLKMPTIYIYLGEDNNSYNASMQTEIWKTTLTGPVATGNNTIEIINEEYNLTVGKELINLFYWDDANTECLKAVIAHEIGHAVNKHHEQLKEHEFEADTSAIKMLKNPEILSQAIDMLTVAGHVYNILAAISSDALKENVHFLIRVMTCSLIKEFPTLGQLGNSSSHTNFAFYVNAALEPILNPNAVGNKSINAAQVVINAYNRLRQVCIAPDKLLGVDGKKQAVLGKVLDELTSRNFSPITHPNPASRKKHMKMRIAEKAKQAIS